MPSVKSCRNRELIYACRVIADRFGPEAVDDLAERHRAHIREAFAEKARQVGRTDLAALREAMNLSSSPNHEYEIIADEPDHFEFKVTNCIHAEEFAAWNARDLGRKFMCAGDEAMVEGFNPRIRFERPKLLMNGDECCHFIYRVDV